MSTYKYQESSVIDEVTFKKTANGAVRAYLHAGPNTDAQALSDVLQALKKEDCQTIPFSLHGKPAVEVRGFGRDSKLLGLLDRNKWISGNPDIKLDAEDKLGWMDKLKKRSLQAAGGLYAFGDASFFMYGLKGKSPLDMAAGIAYGVPTPVLLAYGRNDQSQLQIKDFAKIMAKEFRKEVNNLPEDCSLSAITADHKKGILQSASDLLQRYPSEFMNLCYATAGACIFIAAAKHLSKPVAKETVEGWVKHLRAADPAVTVEQAANLATKNVRLENYLNAGVGMTTVASGTFGAFVREKAHDTDDKTAGGLSGLWEKMRERPLTVAAAGFMVSTLLHAAATAVAVRGQDAQHKQAVPFRVAFVASALMAELMVAISSKGHGEGVVSDTSVDDSAVAIAADLIVKQPKGMHNHLIEQMGKFLGRPDVLALKDEEAIDRLRKNVEANLNNPWVEAEGVSSHSQAQNEAAGGMAARAEEAAPAAAPKPLPIPKSDLPKWQAKVTPPPDKPGAQTQPLA